MKRCDPRAYSRCPHREQCGLNIHAFFVEGSECDAFNQKVLEAPMTNADWLRSLDDEGLVEMLVVNIKGLAPTTLYLSLATGVAYISRRFAVDETRKWLRQPHEEVHT